MGPEGWYEMYIRPFHPELASVGMRVLAQVISAASCDGRGQPSCGGRSVRPSGGRSTPAGCGPSTSPSQAHTAGPLPLGVRASHRR